MTTIYMSSLSKNKNKTAFVLMCFGPGLDFGYSLEWFIEAVLTCARNLYGLSKNKNKTKTFQQKLSFLLLEKIAVYCI